MTEEDKLKLLIRYLEENLRASSTAGLNYIDPRDFTKRFISNQNHVIFGRRGAGKSMLIKTVESNTEIVPIIINLEDFKDISFPNIIIKVLQVAFENLEKKISSCITSILPFKQRELRFHRKQLRKKISNLKELILQPDNYSQTEELKTSDCFMIEGGLGNSKANAKSTGKVETSTGIIRDITYDKLEKLRINLTEYKNDFKIASDLLADKNIFLIFDDFYFIAKTIQPEFLDYFHRLTKDNPVFLKVATIKHRSKLNQNISGKFTGTELRHDIFPIDLDYTLDNFNSLTEFMNKILFQVLETQQCQFVNRLFSGNGFNQLCLASGGVPRDFLSLLTTLLDKYLNKSIKGIGKMEVNESAINNISSKMDSFRTDSEKEQTALENYLQGIKDFVIDTKKQNTFLVSKEELDTFPNERQAIRELCDLRFFHQVESNISAAPSDGKRYEAYIVDPGLYPNARPVNFKQLDPTEEDERSRKDKLRASPRLELAVLREKLKNQNHNLELSNVND